MSIINIIKNTIKKHKLVSYGDKIIVAISGGADSCCLLHALASLSDEYKLTIYAAHVNHNLRSEALSDQRFVEDFCKTLNVECFVKSADVRAYASKYKLSEEDAGRQIRYSFFNELKEQLSADKIATAHNKNDSGETILMNFMRGSSLSGLCGIPYCRSGGIIRPVLDLTRAQIEKYCIDNNINYVTDKTNLETIYTRNKIRLELIPFIQQNFNSAFINRITSNADIISAENDFIKEQSEIFYKKLINEKNNEYSLIINEFNSVHTAIKRRVLIKLIQNISNSEKNISGKYIQSIIDFADISNTGKSINLPDNITAYVDYGKLIISKKTLCIADNFSFLVKIGDNHINDYIITASYCDSAKKSTNNTVYISTEVFDGLIARNRQNGDIFYPVGMTGSKKLKDFFIDTKISLQERSTIPILTTSDNEIIWIVGKRADRRFLADTGNKCIKITFAERNTDDENS